MHGLVLHKLEGRTYALRLSLGAYFAIERDIPDGVGAAVARIHLSCFYLSDVVTLLHHLLVGGGTSQIESAGIIERMTIRDVVQMRHAIANAVAAASFDDAPSATPKRGKGSKAGKGRGQGEIYKVAFSIGLKPAEVDNMTVWQWEKCIDGWNAAHAAEGKGGSAPTKDEMAELLAWADGK